MARASRDLQKKLQDAQRLLESTAQLVSGNGTACVVLDQLRSTEFVLRATADATRQEMTSLGAGDDPDPGAG